MTATVRLANLQDSVVLARIHRECFSEAWTEDSIRRLLENPNAFALLAGSATAPAFECFVLIQVAADQAEILGIGTSPNARGAGLAAAVLQAAMAEARRRDAHAMFLDVAEDNAAALALYSGAGFQVVGRRRF